MTLERYNAQVALLLRTIPYIAVEDAFALKGGTAINLFVRDLPRLSVDIDLVYLPVEERAASLEAIRTAFVRIAKRVRDRLGATVHMQGSEEGTRLAVRLAAAQIKIELSPVLRGTVFEPELRSVSDAVEDRFGFAEMNVVSLPDLYAGKIAAALDRQHPRDLFDIHYLYENEGVTDDIFKAFLVYLISHKRPPHELLAPHLKDLAQEYDGEFVGMTVEPMLLADLVAARARLIDDIVTRARQPRPRAFLLSFFAREPDWALLDLTTDVAALPAVRWKLLQLERFANEQPDKFDAQLASLEGVLGI